MRSINSQLVCNLKERLKIFEAEMLILEIEISTLFFYMFQVSIMILKYFTNQLYAWNEIIIALYFAVFNLFIVTWRVKGL